MAVSSQFAGQTMKNGVLALTATQQLGVTGRWALIGQLGLNFGEFSTLPGTGARLVGNPPVLVQFPTDAARG
ncbi:MAG: hypothetical protein KIT22_00475 [Verrucomicrobiae bacterium]|nr:hypothetical protein [Verrucomicrobiae bacterium]